MQRNVSPKKPALREEMLLNGTWGENKRVPVYEGIKNFDAETYSRRVMVPAAWAGKIVKLEFGAVNFIADVFVNDVLLTQHVGGWMPFAVDVTGKVTPGAEFALKVVVKGPKHAPITNARGGPQWPVGGWPNKGGIADDVYLRAYGGQVHIEDTFIQTSFRKKELAADYTLVNTSPIARAVQIMARVAPSVGGRLATGTLNLVGPTMTLKPGERRIVRARWKWANPTLYWPDAPALYNLQSMVRERGKTLDTETRRFGFREFWIVGNQIYLNGVRANLFGDYQSIDGGYHSSASDFTPAGWPATVDKIKAMNIRVLRFHHAPMPAYLLDVCDEKGLLVCSESSNYAREYHLKTDKADYIRNSVASIAPWIIAQRNHPSIYIWNATNEMTYPHLGGFSAEQCVAVGDEIRKHDATRFIGYDGDAENGRKKYGTVNGELVNHHYPEGYNKEPKGSIYGWASIVHPTRPTGSGELLHTRDGSHPELRENVERNQWWLGIWLRGLRWANWTDVRPSCYWFAAKDLESGDSLQRARGENLRNALAPIALFDKAYDDLGIAPYVTGVTPGGVLPMLESGSEARRTLILYNDDWRDTRVTITVHLRTSNREFARGTKTLDVPMGQHIEIPISFQVPAQEGILDLVLQTAKKNVVRFEEVRRFTLTGENSGATNAMIRIGEAEKL